MGNLVQSPGSAHLPGTPGPSYCSYHIPKAPFPGHVHVQTPLLGSVWKKRFVTSFMNGDLVLVWSALLQQRAGFLNALIQILLGNPLVFFPWKNHLWVSAWALGFLSLWRQVLPMFPTSPEPSFHFFVLRPCESPQAF